MCRKMLGLAIALSTFGLGVSATTLWLAYSTPAVSELESQVVAETKLVRVPSQINVEQAPASEAHLGANPQARGVLNGKALSQPAPAYPKLARAAGVSGTAVVLVTVDEGGRVIASHGVSGHPLLLRAAVRAAYDARFEPFLVAGRPSKFFGTLSYNFLLQ